MKNNPQTPAQLLFAAITGLAAGMGNPFGTLGKSEPKQRKPVPKMVTASREEIAAWNAAVEAKKPRASQAGIRMRREDNRTIGHRQAKREAYLFHDGYADKHPTIAARYAY